MSYTVGGVAFEIVQPQPGFHFVPTDHRTRPSRGFGATLGRVVTLDPGDVATIVGFRDSAARVAFEDLELGISGFVRVVHIHNRARYEGWCLHLALLELGAFVDVATSAAWTTLELSWAGGVTNAEPVGWKLSGFDDSSWDPGYVPPDPDANWTAIAGAAFLASQGRALGHLQDEAWLARHEFTLAGDALADGALTFATDDTCVVYLDGVEVASLPTPDFDNWLIPHSVTIPMEVLTAGGHVLGVEVNQAAIGSTWATNPTMFEATLSVLVAE